MISIGNDCCGCTACANICPKKCIEMKPNAEGFIYPVIDTEKCIDCNACERACPVIERKSNTSKYDLTGYIFQNKDSVILKQSTSGGFFTALSEYIINNDGVVFGAAYDSNFYIHHTYVEKIEDLKFFRNSKYTQSDATDSFKKCREFLKQDRLVLFSGTPCQIEGLKKFLNKEYENLITVDVVCRGVPSPGLFKKYIKWNGGAEFIQDVKFRKKYTDYFNGFMEVSFKDGRKIDREKYTDPMLNFFFMDICSRKSCYDCKFKTVDRISDFTMFDCWHAHVFNKSFKNKGATAVIVRNEKAQTIMEKLARGNLCIEADYNKLIAADGIMVTNSVNMNPLRDEFFKDLASHDLDYVLEKYDKKSALRKLKLKIKVILMKLGIFGKLYQAKIR